MLEVHVFPRFNYWLVSFLADYHGELQKYLMMKWKAMLEILCVHLKCICCVQSRSQHAEGLNIGGAN